MPPLTPFYPRTPQRNRNELGETTVNKNGMETIATARKINNLEHTHCVRDAVPATQRHFSSQLKTNRTTFRWLALVQKARGVLSKTFGMKAVMDARSRLSVSNVHVDISYEKFCVAFRSRDFSDVS
jgi:hypothetical protein